MPTAWTVEAMNPLGQGAYRRTMDAGRDIKGLGDVERGWMEYQFIATGPDGHALARTQVYGDLAFAALRRRRAAHSPDYPTPILVR